MVKEWRLVVLMVLAMLIGGMLGLMLAASAYSNDAHNKAVASGQLTHNGKLYIVRPAKVVEE